MFTQEPLFEEPLQENYLVKEAIKYIDSYEVDFFINQAKEKGNFSYEILVGIIDYLIDTKSKQEKLEYHHFSFTNEILLKMINSPLDNWRSPELRRHYLVELKLKMEMFASENFQEEMRLEERRKTLVKAENTDSLSLEDFEKEIDKE